MRKKLNPFIFSKYSTINIIKNNIFWGLMVSVNYSLLILISKSVTATSDAPGIKTLPVFLIMGPLLWILSIIWVMTIKLFDEFKYNMLSSTLMAVLAIPLYLIFGIISYIVAIIALFIRYKITEAREEEEKRIASLKQNRNIKKKKKR